MKPKAQGLELYFDQYREELLEQVIPWWEHFSPDKKYGGYFTCITDEGEVFDTDKFVWLQARQAWMFAKLYQEVEQKTSWFDMALSGIDFLEKHGRDRSGNWYFSLTNNGKPLVQPYNIFSDCFAALAFGAAYKIDGNPRYANVAKDTFSQIIDRKNNPKGVYNKVFPGTRPLQNFALPMILCNLAMELEHLLDLSYLDQLTENLINLIVGNFYHKESGLMLENIDRNGKAVDSFEGRLISPGHALESLWFLQKIAIRNHHQELLDFVSNTVFSQLENGWDNEDDGIFYFLDRKGYPPQQLEWDQKLWWVHLEALVALAKVYLYNQSSKSMCWFDKVHNYTWNHFRDHKRGGEWYGYLNRHGEVLLRLKGGKWKGCFHVPRALLEISDTLAQVDQQAAPKPPNK
jgi:N-acylglucosamine 2-epimerase